MSLRHNKCVCACRYDDPTSTDFSSGGLFAQEPSTSVCSFASRFDVDANPAMEKSCAGGRGSVAKTCPAVPCPCYPCSLASCFGHVAKKHPPRSRKQRAHIHRNSLFVEPINGHQWTFATGNAGDVAPSSNILPQLRQVHREAKTKAKAKAKDGATISQRAAQIVNGVSAEEERDNVCPRCDRELYAFRTASGKIMRCRGWDLYWRWRFGDGFRWPTRWSKGEHAARTGRCSQNPTLINDWTAQMQALDVQPRVGARTIRSVAAPSSTLPSSSVSAAARSVIQPGVVTDVPALRRGRRVLWGSVEHGCANGSNRSVIARSDARPDVFNHESNRCVDAQPNLETKEVLLLTLRQAITEHPCELQQEVKIPKLAEMIGERGAWPHYRPLAVFWAPAGAKDRSHEFCASSRDTLLGGIIAQIKLDDGSHLNVVDDSDLADFICHHAWFEGDEVALPREDRVCQLGNLTGGTGTTELEPECGDDAVNTRRPLTPNQQKIIQNIHNNCGHPNREEFPRALRLSRAQAEVLSYVRREFECPARVAKRHPPKPRMPAALLRTFRFNDLLDVYLFEIESPDGTEIRFCKKVCWGTLYQLCIPILDKTAATAARCITERWIQYFGPPLVVIGDQGKEFVGTQRGHECEQHSFL